MVLLLERHHFKIVACAEVLVYTGPSLTVVLIDVVDYFSKFMIFPYFEILSSQESFNYVSDKMESVQCKRALFIFTRMS